MYTPMPYLRHISKSTTLRLEIRATVLKPYLYQYCGCIQTKGRVQSLPLHNAAGCREKLEPVFSWVWPYEKQHMSNE